MTTHPGTVVAVVAVFAAFFLSVAIGRLADTRQANLIFDLIKRFIVSRYFPGLVLAMTAVGIYPLFIILATSDLSENGKFYALVAYLTFLIATIALSIIRWRRINETENASAPTN